MARTTLNLDPSVLTELKARGAAEGRSIGDVASELLARALHEAATLPPGRPAFAWRTASLGEPSVDLYDKEALRRALDDR